METESIEKYLHLYIGCEVIYGYEGRSYTGRLTGKVEAYGWEVFNTKLLFDIYHKVRGELIKPLLRPLSSMTEEEARVILPDMPEEQELIEHGYLNEFADGNVFYQYLARAEDERLSPTLEDSLGVPEHWLFLLSKGFDLFNLIEKGLAIDSTQSKK